MQHVKRLMSLMASFFPTQKRSVDLPRKCGSVGGVVTWKFYPASQFGDFHHTTPSIWQSSIHVTSLNELIKVSCTHERIIQASDVNNTGATRISGILSTKVVRVVTWKFDPVSQFTDFHNTTPSIWQSSIHMTLFNEYKKCCTLMRGSFIWRLGTVLSWNFRVMLYLSNCCLITKRGHLKL